jgi:hypothetical protein
MVRQPSKPRTSRAEGDHPFRRHAIGQAVGRLALEVEAGGVPRECGGVDDEHGSARNIRFQLLALVEPAGPVRSRVAGRSGRFRCSHRAMILAVASESSTSASLQPAGASAAAISDIPDFGGRALNPARLASSVREIPRAAAAPATIWLMAGLSRSGSRPQSALDRSQSLQGLPPVIACETASPARRRDRVRQRRA